MKSVKLLSAQEQFDKLDKSKLEAFILELTTEQRSELMALAVKADLVHSVFYRTNELKEAVKDNAAAREVLFSAAQTISNRFCVDNFSAGQTIFLKKRPADQLSQIREKKQTAEVFEFFQSLESKPVSCEAGGEL